jgi:uncharacterized protein (DUF1501 family)
MTISRRVFLRNGALAIAGTSAIPSFLVRSVMAQTTGAASVRNKRLVVIFQRGAADGLNIVIPHAEPQYFAMRPTIAIPREKILDLDGFFGLHPAMAPLLPLYRSGHLAMVHATGSPDPTRSHFDAQDYMESGTPGVKITTDGWLNRALQAEDERRARVTDHSPFRAISVGNDVPRTLAGPVHAMALRNLQDFSQLDRMDRTDGDPFESMYDESSDSLIRGAGSEAFEAMRMLRSAQPQKYTPAPGVEYPATQFGSSLRQIAQLLKGNFGVQAAFADVGGWDHHVNEGAEHGQLANRLDDFSRSLIAFWVDLGDASEDTVVVTMSEFGRTAHQNGTGGTDHGHANVMFALGGPVRGGRVHGRWPGLAPEQLYQQRDLAVTTDFRQVLAEATFKTLGASDLHRVFPGSAVTQQSFLNVLA